VKINKIIDFLRIYKWYKNFLLFIPSILEFGIIATLTNIPLIVGFFLFSTTASGLYIINDVMDKNRDKLHPEKKKRLVASGRIKTSTAMLIAILMISTFGISLSYLSWIIFPYVISALLYSFILRNIPIVDCMGISLNSILRLAIGYSIIGIYPNYALLSLLFFITMITSLSKRSREYIETKGESKYRDFFGNIPEQDIKLLSIVNLSAIIISLLFVASYLGIISSMILGILIVRLELYLLYSPLKTGSFRTLIKDKPVVIMLLALLISISIEVLL